MSDTVPLNNISASRETFVVGDKVKITDRDSWLFEKIGKIVDLTETQLKVVFEEDDKFVRFINFSDAEVLQQPPETVSGNATEENKFLYIAKLDEDERDIMFLHLAEHVATMLIHTLGVGENLEERLGKFVQSVRNSIREFTDEWNNICIKIVKIIIIV